MAKITLSFSKQAGDIPTYEFTKFQLDNEDFIEEQLRLSDDNVFVCFQSWKNEPYELEHPTFLVSKNIDDCLEWFSEHITFITCKEIDFNFFCFETYEQAFKYCIDLPF